MFDPGLTRNRLSTNQLLGPNTAGEFVENCRKLRSSHVERNPDCFAQPVADGVSEFSSQFVPSCRAAIIPASSPLLEQCSIVH